MKKFLKAILNLFYIMRFKPNAWLGEKILLNRNSKIISDNKEDVHISNNVMMFGSLISKNGGKITIGKNTSIRTGCKIFSTKKVEIGENVIFADNVIITDTNHHPVNPLDRLKMIDSGWSTEYWSWKYSESKEVIIGNNVWLGQYSRVIKGVKIGENSIVASNSVITKDIPANCIAAGNPAKVVKTNIQKEPRLL